MLACWLVVVGWLTGCFVVCLWTNRITKSQPKERAPAASTSPCSPLFLSFLLLSQGKAALIGAGPQGAPAARDEPAGPHAQAVVEKQAGRSFLFTFSRQLKYFDKIIRKAIQAGNVRSSKPSPPLVFESAGFRPDRTQMGSGPVPQLLAQAYINKRPKKRGVGKTPLSFFPIPFKLRWRR